MSKHEENYIDFFRDNLGAYVFGTVAKRFHNQKCLDTVDFFCIVIWKANRAKSTIAKGLKKIDPDLDKAVRQLTRELHDQPNSKSRFKYLRAKGFRLPFASAILTVLYPKEFTVFDLRVCESLDGKGHGFKYLDRRKSFDSLWEGYQEFKQCVLDTTPPNLSLREKDQWLWGESFYKALCKDIKKYRKL